MMNRTNETFLQKQLRAGVFSHAYLLWGDGENQKESIIHDCLRLTLGARFAANPNFFELISDTKSGAISIEAMRNMRRRVFQTPFAHEEKKQAARIQKIFLVRGLEKITREAAPIFLRILEEPPAGVLFLATTTNLGRISLPIRSRFSLVRVVKDIVPEIHKNEIFECFAADTLTKRFESIPKLLDSENLEKVLRFVILKKEIEIKNGARTENIAQTICELEKLWRAYTAYQFDPTANKRMLGEYAALFV